MNIVEFIEARIGEDEQIARTASSLDGDSWSPEGSFGDDDFDRVTGTGQGSVCYDTTYTAAPHIARHDPARVLRQCKTIRVMLMRYSKVSNIELPTPLDEEYELGLRQDMESIASIWSDHPDYDTTWS